MPPGGVPRRVRVVSRFKLDVTVTVNAKDATDAQRIVSRLLNSTHPSESEEPVEKITFGGLKPETLSPWRPATEAPRNGKSFFAINRGLGQDAEEFATSVRWLQTKESFVDSTLQPFQFTHWMPIPTL